MDAQPEHPPTPTGPAPCAGAVDPTGAPWPGVGEWQDSSLDLRAGLVLQEWSGAPPPMGLLA